MSYKLLVISDLHVTDEQSTSSQDSRISTYSNAGDVLSDPLIGLLAYVAEKKIRADALLCPGDMTNKANPAAQAYAWQKIQDLKKVLQAKVIIAVPGNHDVDSRNAYNQYDAKGHLLSLNPYFPGLSEALCDRFWARNFVIFHHNRVRYLLLNSAAYHGGGKDQGEEYEKGRVSDRTIAEITRSLKANGDDFLLNILVTHHHPLKFDRLGELDVSQMEGGDHLLTALSANFPRPWFVLHGHRHVARLMNGGADNSSAIIFCAGSLGSRLNSPIPPNVANQFHVIDFPIGEPDFVNLGVCGAVQSWDWADGIGWQDASLSGGLPSRAGFGIRGSNVAFANDLAKVVIGLVDPNASFKIIKWEQVVQKATQFRFLAPKDLAAVLSLLKKDHNIHAQRDDTTGALSMLEVR